MIIATEHCDLINTGYDANCTDYVRLLYRLDAEVRPIRKIT